MRLYRFLVAIGLLLLALGIQAPTGDAQTANPSAKTANPSPAAEKTPQSIDWANLQFPPALSHVMSATDSTNTVYGQIYIAGETDAKDEPVSGVTAQVGYGPPGTLPSGGEWEWFDMRPNPAHDFTQNTDEYLGRMLPDRSGTFKYTTRWSVDGGESWIYTDRYGPPYDEVDAGDMTVDRPSETVPPSVPTGLTATASSFGAVSLSWDEHPNIDEDLAGFRVYRQPAGDSGYREIAEILSPDATTFVDTTVSPGTAYAYEVSAFDDGYVESKPSSTAQVDVPAAVEVTFRVAVPAHTPDAFPVYLSGTFQDPEFDPDDPDWQLQAVDATTWTITRTLTEGTQHQYRYVRGASSRRETRADGNTDREKRSFTVSGGGDGTQLIEDTVMNWRDPYVIEGTPPDGTSGLVGADVEVTLRWNQAMPSELAAFQLSGPNGTVDGIWTYDAGQKRHTFSPDDPLPTGTYTASVSDATDAAGQTQEVDYSASWSVSTLPVEFAGFEGYFSDDTVKLSWTTASETGNARFDVQRTAGRPSTADSGATWSTVGSVDGRGTTDEPQSYRFTDADLPYETDSLTYRLQQVDLDGTVSYSDPITIGRPSVSRVEFQNTYPNPARQRVTARFTLPRSAAQDATLQLYDVLGREVRSIDVPGEGGRHEQTLDVSGLPSGVYVLRLKAGGTAEARRLTVVR
jgi:hypothetical protein